MDNNNNGKWPEIKVTTPLGELIATANPDPDYPEIYTFLRRADGLEIDLASVTINKEKNESHIYVYNDTSIESPTDEFVLSKGELLIDMGRHYRPTNVCVYGPLTKYVSSMLFPAETEIASVDLKDDESDKTVQARLVVRGSVCVEYHGECYTDPAEFPDELIQRITDHPYDWWMEAPDPDHEGDIGPIDTNWFEIIAESDGVSEGIMFSGEPSQMTEGQLIDTIVSEINESAFFSEGSRG